jgi:hypothetical protein
MSTLSDAGHVSCRKYFFCPKILLPVGVFVVFLGHLFVRMRIVNASRTTANDSMRSSV